MLTNPARVAIGALLVLFALAAIGVVMTTRFTWSHDAIPTAAQPKGWTYPFNCCSGMDCREVAGIGERPEGYLVPSGEMVGYGDKRIKDSPDGLFHWCSVNGKPDGKTICLFVPPRAY